MANTKEEQKGIAKHLYMKGVATDKILALTKVCRQTLSRWVNKEGWKDERAARAMSKEEITSKTLAKLGDAIESTETDEKSINRMTDSLVKAAKGLSAINSSTTIVNKIDTLMELENWMVEHRDDYPELDEKTIMFINQLHSDFMGIKFKKKTPRNAQIPSIKR